jgi:hypothetical protein
MASGDSGDYGTHLITVYAAVVHNPHHSNAAAGYTYAEYSHAKLVLCRPNKGLHITVPSGGLKGGSPGWQNPSCQRPL